MSSCQQLKTLDLPENRLTGSIPTKIFRRKKNKENKSNIASPLKGFPLIISYSNIHHATSNFSAENLIGKGECEALRNIRYRNVVKVITSWLSIDHKGDEFKAPIVKFMPNGNTDRYASAMDYLHNDCNPPVVHCDLKPENGKSITIGLKSSIGSTAPEYGLGGKASTSGDVHSFGILLLEIFIAKKPTDAMFKEGSNLNEFAFATTLDGQALNHIIDPRLLKNITDGSPMQSLGITSSSSSSNSNRTSHSCRMEKYKESLGAVIRAGLAYARSSKCKRSFIHQRGPGEVTTD
ncbi:hypothetical protein SLEP1_g55044 [Rubroshorea leprosula]|uniref:Protein kinase domain-containing protein n=1 Tax=Rubroshorea leprosula TaxID=152421 RepID=A0AAV5ME91_9ROSI|nr:hypothetical protein SLEP1_g55044 [Rubroshorea leprosula]